MSYQQSKISQKWNQVWDELKLNQAQDNLDQKKYILVEFPYPSGSGLHVGHAFSFTGADVYARFKRMQGENVLFPIGWDAFGLPTENYAIKQKRKPQDITKENTDFFRQQMKELAFSFDWSREVNTTDPEYYRWTQWIFIKLFKAGLAYKEKMPINWCPSCKIGLANEEVVDNKCERCGSETTRKDISQWIVKITDYADRLISGLSKTDFIEKVKTAQINWIGKSKGAKVNFKVIEDDYTLEVFTTRPDTLWGATFMVVAPEHELVQKALNHPELDLKTKEEIKKYLKQTSKKSDLERTELNKEKTGVFTGWHAINPVNQEKIPIWISDFVLASYGAGAIMSVPAHDQRDWDFAKKYNLLIIPVIQPTEGWDFDQSAYTEVEKGIIVNSKPINGFTPEKAFKKTLDWLKEKGIGSAASNYHLRDWIFSRQHYWGEPIPMIYCEKCGWQSVKEEDLPIKLPEIEHYQPTNTGESPLAKIDDWVKTKCPKCGGLAERETDTMPNWAGSDWYFLRYLDPKNNRSLAGMNKMKQWMPVDVYVGGDEHNTLHLLYSRFIYQFLWDNNWVPKEHPEPYQKRISHGVILGPDGQRMSKSRGNVVVPQEIIKRFDKFGADILRMYLMFIGPFDGTMAWNDNALLGMKRYLDRIEGYIDDWMKIGSDKNGQLAISEGGLEVFLHQTIKKVTQDINQMNFNTAIAQLMSFLNKMREGEGLNKEIGLLSKSDLEKFILLHAPLTPFFAEEMWQKINPKQGKLSSIFQQNWPKFDLTKTKNEKIELVVQINGKVRDKLLVSPDILEQDAKEKALSSDKVQKFLEGHEVKKVIFVPRRLINLVK